MGFPLFLTYSFKHALHCLEEPSSIFYKLASFESPLPLKSVCVCSGPRGGQPGCEGITAGGQAEGERSQHQGSCFGGGDRAA